MSPLEPVTEARDYSIGNSVPSAFIAVVSTRPRPTIVPLAGAPVALHSGCVDRTQTGRDDERLQPLADRLLARVAEHVHSGRIEVEDEAIEVRDDDRIRRRVDRSRVAIVSLLQRPGFAAGNQDLAMENGERRDKTADEQPI